MSIIEKVSFVLVALFLIVTCVRLFAAPLKLILRILFNSALGFGALWLLNLTSSFTGLHLGLSLFNALTVGILGVPGFFLLLLTQWVLT
ncbi:MAG: pro-sigmaK processing inhibitor BofA family protein [Clostridiales bacterium]|nr:pro-sigmaK processing inhibitor BofA family protein [Candidatus Cacconaster stercorequi]